MTKIYETGTYVFKRHRVAEYPLELPSHPAEKPLEAKPGSNLPSSITSSEIQQDRLTKIAEESWIKTEGKLLKKPFDPEVVKEIYVTELKVTSGRKPVPLQRVMILEVSKYLENYLCPNFDPETATFEHVMSMILMINEKFGENVAAAWICFHDRDDLFKKFLQTVLRLKEGRDLTIAEKTNYLVFMINAFQLKLAAQTEVIVSFFEKQQSQKEAINALPLYTNEQIMWDESVIPTINYSGEDCLALPKLYLQFLTLHDYLLRNFNLESTYEIHEDIQETVPHLLAHINNEGETDFRGWSRMAVLISEFKIAQVKQPNIGEEKPSSVTVEVTFSIKSYRSQIISKWNSLKEHDVLFLLCIRPSSEPLGPEETDKATVLQRLGLQYVRCSEIIDIRDEERNLMNDFTGTVKRDEWKPPKGEMRIVTVALNAAQYHIDVTDIAEKGAEDVYSSFNVLMRRKPNENNFNAILESIRDLMNEYCIAPERLHNVFLGYGNPSAAQWPNMPNLLETVDFKDTFLDANHLSESFPDYEVSFINADGAEALVPIPPFRITLPKTLKGNAAISGNKISEVNPTDNGKAEAYLKVKCIVEANTLPDPGPYPQDQPKQNSVKFTPTQVGAIVSGIQHGLTTVVAPPGKQQKKEEEKYRRRRVFRLPLGSSRETDIDITQAETEPVSDEMSSYEDESEEDENGIIMRGIRRSVALDRLSSRFRSRIRAKSSVKISSRRVKKLLENEERFSFVSATNPLGSFYLLDDTVYLSLYWKTGNILEDQLLPRETAQKLIRACGKIRDQYQHDSCWTYAASDMVSAALVLHGWQKEYTPLCPKYLMENVDKERFAEVRFEDDGQKHCCYGEELETALFYIKDSGIPLERVQDLKSNCWKRRPLSEDEELFYINGVFRYPTMEKALIRLRTGHPVGATLFGFTGWDGNGIYRGPLNEGEVEFKGFHGVIMVDCTKIDGEIVAVCKSSSGEDFGYVGFNGYILVSLEVMFLFAGLRRNNRNANNRTCQIKPTYLLTNFYSVGMKYKEPTKATEKEERKNRRYKIDNEESESVESSKRQKVGMPLSLQGLCCTIPRYLRPLVADIAVVLKCRLSALYKHEKGKLFAQLVDLLQFYEKFDINDHDGTQLTDDEALQFHHDRFMAFQLLAFKKIHKLQDLALANIGSVHKSSDIRRRLSVLSLEDLRDAVCSKSDVPARNLLRLGQGEQELATEFNAMLVRRLELLNEVERLARSLQLPEEMACHKRKMT